MRCNSWLALGKLFQLRLCRPRRQIPRGIALAARPTDKNDRATIRRTLHYFWGVTRQKMGAFVLSIVSSVGYIALLTFANTYVMGLIVDRVQASPVSADQVLPVFGPYVLALLVVNAVGQTLS